MMNDLVSIVIPTYRRPEKLKRAIASTLAQNYENIELLVIDDNANDHDCRSATRKALESFSVDIRYMPNEMSLGGSGSRNVGINLAKGDFVAFLDDDDEWLPEKLSKQMQVFGDSDPSVACVDTGFIRINEVNNSVEQISAACITGNAFEWLLLKRRGRAPKLSSVICRKSALLSVGLFDSALPSRQDLDLYLRLSSRFQFVSLDEPLVVNYIHQEPRISTNYVAKTDGYKMFYDKYETQIQSNPRIHSAYLTKYAEQLFRSGEDKAAREMMRLAVKIDVKNVRALFIYVLGFSFSKKLKKTIH